MPKKKKNSQGNAFSSDNGVYERYIQENGKAGGITRRAVKLSRNDKCPCGSGKKFKSCCKPKGTLFIKRKNSFSLSRWPLFFGRIKKSIGIK